MLDSTTVNSAWRLVALWGLFLISAPAAAQFVDDFGRSDSSDVGNGWIEKSPQAFSLNAGRIEKNQVGSEYRDNIVYRPAAENLLNVDVSVELELNALPPRYPQILARVQTDTVAVGSYMDAYILYMANDSQTAVLGRQLGGSFVETLANIAIWPALNTADTYRMRLNVSGTSPVDIVASIERFDGSGWATIGQATVADNSGLRIATAGSVGFGGHSYESEYSYDNFTRVDLDSGSSGNPAPIQTSIAPASATEGDPGFTLTVNGNDFIDSSVVRWDGQDRATTFVSANQLQAAISAADIAVIGTATVTVATPAPGGGVSLGQTFTINETVVNNPTPIITGISPTSATEGDPGFTLVVNGSDFVNSSVVRWNGQDRVTTIVSANELQAAITAADIAASGTATVTVATPGPGGGVSTGQTFTIDEAVVVNPAPVLGGITPSSANEGDPGFTLTINGSDFIGSSAVRWNGQDRVTTFVSGNELQAAITAADIAVNGNATVTVQTPGPGGGVSAGQTFTINEVIVDNPAPVLGSLAPSSADEGGPGFTLTVNGSDFINSSVVRWNGQDRATTFVSANELQATVTAADIAASGTATVTVATPGPGGGVSAGQTFTINEVIVTNPVPVMGGISPSSATEGDPGFTLTVNGSNFINSSAVRWNGQDRATTFISSNEIRATIGSGDIAANGTAAVTVATPGPGGGVSAGVSFTVFEAAPEPTPVPYISGMWPVEVEAGTGAVAVTIWGGDFGEYTELLWNGQVRPNFFSATQEITLLLSADDVTTPGFFDIRAVNPAPGGGTSGTMYLEVTPATGNPQAPKLTNVSPGSATVGSGNAILAITGDNFTPDSEVRWNGASRPTVFVSEQALETTVPATDFNAARTSTVSVYTPGPGGGISAPQTFFVYDPATSFFYDNFNRPDSNTIGNGWTEKSDFEFLLMDGEVLSIESGLDYRDTIFYRPQAEDRQDVEVSVEIRKFANMANLPQLHARVQRDSVQTPQLLESYIFFVNDIDLGPVQAAIAVQGPVDGSECFIGVMDFPSELEFGERYRLRFRVSGTNPVQLTGFVDEWNGSTWSLLVTGSVTHDDSTQPDPNLFCDRGVMPAPIPGAGSVGLAKWWPRTDAYDNFYWRDIVADPGINPIPLLNSISPDTVTAGDTGVVMTLDGVNFLLESEVRWNGSALPTMYLGPNQLQVAIPDQSIAQGTVASMTVFNPGPGGGESAPLNFVVQDPSPEPTAVLDNFDRPDSSSLGFGWIEKNPAAFTLVNGAVVKQPVGTGYLDNVVYRPASENLLNAESSVEFRLSVTTPGYPQLFARLQTDTAAIPGSLDGYLMYLSDSSTDAVLARQTGPSFATSLANMVINPGLNTNDLYRMRLRVEGVAPVQLNAYIDRFNGAGWDVIGQTSASDNSGVRITTPGSTGFGGYVEASYQYDNFDVQDLGQ